MHQHDFSRARLVVGASKFRSIWPEETSRAEPWRTAGAPLMRLLFTRDLQACVISNYYSGSWNSDCEKKALTKGAGRLYERAAAKVRQ